MSCINRIGNCTCNILQHYSETRCVNLMFVRYRKPRWLPKAPSKVFKVREPTPIDQVECEKMKEWTAQYNTARKSVMRYLHNHDIQLRERERQRFLEQSLTFDEIYNEMAFKNEDWNRKTAKIREADLAAKAEVDDVRKQKLAERDVREQEEIREKARQKVLAAQEWKENYVTEENLDAIVEETLNTRVNYEYALNPDGTKTESTDPAKNKT